MTAPATTMIGAVMTVVVKDGIDLDTIWDAAIRARQAFTPRLKGTWSASDDTLRQVHVLLRRWPR